MKTQKLGRLYRRLRQNERIRIGDRFYCLPNRPIPQPTSDIEIEGFNLWLKPAYYLYTEIVEDACNTDLIGMTPKELGVTVIRFVDCVPIDK